MELKVGDRVSLIIGRKSQLGFTVLVDQEFEGMLYSTELYQRLVEGEVRDGYIKKIREDGKIDVTLTPIGFFHANATQEKYLIEKMVANNGFLPLTDKSSPDDIKYGVEMSKKAFKKAIGGLYKAKKITIEKDGIRLV